MQNVIIIAIIALAVGFALAKIIRAKKNGQMCMGCPNSGQCSGGCSCHK